MKAFIQYRKGFQVEEYLDKYKMDFPTCEVLMFACGSGLAPIAAAIDSGKLQLKTTGTTFAAVSSL
jgi:hypothetical protein